MEQQPSIVIAASACLLGQELRYDGGHKRHDYLCRVLSQRFSIVAVCPEVELGLAVPREPLELVDINGESRLLGSRSGDDHSQAMRAYARRRIGELSSLGICGYVLKSRSPSCAARLGDYPASPAESARTRGLFAELLFTVLPRLPIVEEQQLDQPITAQRFIDAVQAYHRLAKP